MVRYREIVNEDKSEMRKKYHELREMFVNQFSGYNDWTLDLDSESISIVGNCQYHQSIDYKYFPVKISEVSGSFDCGSVADGPALLSLKNAPNKVGKSFDCADNKITSLEYGPKIVQNDYICTRNEIINLEHMPTYVGGNFVAFDNPLQSIQGIEKCKISGIAYLPWNADLPLLRVLVLPNSVTIVDNPDDDNMIGSDVNSILKRYKNISNKKKSIYDCQYALIKAGFKGNAKW